MKKRPNSKQKGREYMNVKKIEKILGKTFKGDKNIKKIEGLEYIENGIVKNVIIIDFLKDPSKTYESIITNTLGKFRAVHHFKYGTGVVNHFRYGNGYALNVCFEEKEAFKMKEGMEIIPNEWYNPVVGYYIYEFFVGNRKFHLHVNKKSNAFLMKEDQNEYPILDIMLFREVIEAHKLVMLLEDIENPLETLKLDINIYVGKKMEYWIRNGKVEKADKGLLKEYSKQGFLSF